MIREIYLDLDGVCNRFVTYVLNFLGCPIGVYEEEKFPPEAGWDIVMAANILCGEIRFTKSQFWSSIPRHIWAEAPESAEFRWLLGHCEALVGQENVCLLTSTTLDPECAAGKLEWIERVMPRWMRRNYLLGPYKRGCAKPHSLLIDDSDKNVAEFQKYGGQALLVPRPWNHMHGANTLAYLTDQFNILFQDKALHS